LSKYYFRLKQTLLFIGLSLYLPGANNDSEYWQLLSFKEAKASLLPKTRHGWESRMREMAIGDYLDDVDTFDPVFLGFRHAKLP